MNHCDSMLLEPEQTCSQNEKAQQSTTRRLVKTFHASKPVPGTYDGVLLSEAFKTVKQPKTNRSNRETDLCVGYEDYFIEWYEADMVEVPEDNGWMVACYMDAIYSPAHYTKAYIGVSDCALSLEDEGSIEIGFGTSLLLAGAIRHPSIRVAAGRSRHMLRMRICKHTGKVTYSHH